MMNYITAMLGLTRVPRSDTGPPLLAVESATSSRLASCRGWSVPDPDVYLRLSNNETVRIFGYPKDGDLPPEMWIPLRNIGNSGPPLLYLRGDSPAYVSYIMGNDWRSRLRTDHQTSDAHIFHDGEVIVRLSATISPLQGSQEDFKASERAHCLRMRRCGAVAVRSEKDIIFEETGEEALPNELFGWPASGGVWVLRSYPFEHSQQHAILPSMALDEMQERLALASEALRQQSDMEGVCRVLEDAGGQFYSRIEDCPEVVKLKLLQ